MVKGYAICVTSEGELVIHREDVPATHFIVGTNSDPIEPEDRDLLRKGIIGPMVILAAEVHDLRAMLKILYLFHRQARIRAAGDMDSEELGAWGRATCYLERLDNLLDKVQAEPEWWRAEMPQLRARLREPGIGTSHEFDRAERLQVELDLANATLSSIGEIAKAEADPHERLLTIWAALQNHKTAVSDATINAKAVGA